MNIRDQQKQAGGQMIHSTLTKSLSAILMVTALFATGIAEAKKVHMRGNAEVSQTIIGAQIAAKAQVRRAENALRQARIVLTPEEKARLEECAYEPWKREGCIDFVQSLITKYAENDAQAALMNAYIDVHQALGKLYIAALSVVDAESLIEFYDAAVAFSNALVHLDELLDSMGQ
jgi:hypothetical protein